MKRFFCFLVLALPSLLGCYWQSGPFVSPQAIRDKYDAIDIKMVQEAVEDKLGKPSEIKYILGADGQPLPDSRAAWLLYKYDYPVEPMLLTIKVDRFGLVTEKHIDTAESLGARLNRQSAEEKVSYPGAPLKQFQDLEKKKKQQGS